MPKSAVRTKPEANPKKGTARSRKPGPVRRHEEATQTGKTEDMARGRKPNVQAEVDREWFIKKLKARGLSQRALAALIAQDAAGMTRVLQGNREISLKQAVGIARELRVRIGELARRLGLDYREQPVAITGAVKGDGRVTAISPRVGHIVEPVMPDGNIKALVVEAKGSALEAYDGAVIFYAAAQGSGSQVPPDAFGRLCVVEALGEVVPILGVLERASTRGLINLRVFGHNDVRELEGVHRASVVVGMILN